MTAAWALIGASWRHAVSYKLSMIISLLGLLASVVPLYFVANALQPVMADVIRGEGSQYFGFLLVGMIAVSFIPVAAQSFPSSVSSGIASGVLEAVLATPASMPAVVVGMTGYSVLWATARALLMMAAAFLMGAVIWWQHLVEALLILALIVLAYLPIGLIGAAMILRFRTMGPLMPAVLIVSSLLGGAYYPTHVIPSWLERIAAFVPLTYGLRALRRVLLDGASLREVASDLWALALFAAVLFLVGASAFQYALRYARRAGTLGHY